MTDNATLPTFTASIYIGGDFDVAKDVCREFCFNVGECVTAEHVQFIYKGGEESGVKVGFIAYPRFPQPIDELKDRARTLARQLLVGLHQHSYSIVFSDVTEFFSRRAAGT